MEREILACIDKKNKKFLESGQISKYIFPMERAVAHNKKISHLITRVFVVSKNPEGEMLYLVQKRGEKKDAFPNYYTDSSSGHVNWEKNLNLNTIKKNALRELYEEFGIKPKDIQKVVFYDINSESDEIAYIFFAFVNHDIQLTPNPEELDVTSSKFYTRTEFLEILKREKCVDYSEKIWRMLLNTDILSFFEKDIKSSTEKVKEIALFIGRFQPLHHGHIYVIKTILKSYRKIKIGIGSSQLSNTLNDPFTSDERKKFITAALKKREISTNRYEIYFIPDIFNAKKWVDHVISIVGEFDAVYSSSNWVRELFRNKDIKLEKKISIFKKKFNGDNIRNLISKNDKKWKNLVPNEVVELIQVFNGINRIKLLNKDNR
ncbi:MAG: nicotinamide-nucleotide adenylyltransferase [Candidatus Thorarchaeota archaeon]